MKSIFKRLLLSISFLTILPVYLLFSKKEESISDNIQDELSKSSVFFPLVGLIIGLILAGIDCLLQWKSIYFTVTNGILLTVWILLSGGLHLEGFADMVDGFSGGQNQEEIFKIMKDGSVGSKGAIALILLVLWKYILLISIPPQFRMKILMIAPILGRWSMVLAGYIGKPASLNNFLSQIFVLHLGKKELVLATVFSFVCSFLVFSYASFIMIILSGITTCFLLFYSSRKIQGLSGDVLGSINELVEVIVMLVPLFLC